MKRKISALLGNIFEHYDQALYGFLAPVLAPLFFPASDPIYSLIYAFALLPLGLIARPLGALLFSALNARFGRTASLKISLFGMTLSTAAIACLPVYAAAGWLAPFLLVLCRLAQNLFSAGEVTGGALYLLETAQKNQRSWISSLFDASGILGIILAALAAAFASDAWRWLFAAGSFSALAALALRKNTHLDVDHPISWQALFSEWKSLFAIAAVSGYSYANYYLITNFFNGFAPLVADIDLSTTLSMNSWMLVLDFILLLLFGWIAKDWDKTKIIKVSLFAAIVLTGPCFLLIEQADASSLFALRCILCVIGVAIAAPYHAWAMEQTSARHRFTICAFGLALGSRLIGAPMPALSLWLFKSTGLAVSAAFPVIAVALLALGSLMILEIEPEPKRNAL